MRKYQLMCCKLTVFRSSRWSKRKAKKKST